MFRGFLRTFFPNRFDWMIRRCAKKGGKKILIAWNRGLGDLALGLYAMIHRIREIIPNAEITFLTRDNLQDGFSFLEHVKTIVAPKWRRGESVSVRKTLEELGIDPKSFDWIVEKPSPTDWVSWQRGKLTPRLQWKALHDPLWRAFDLPDGYRYIGVQVVAETTYGTWRNWPLERWQELFRRLEKFPKIRVLLFGFGTTPHFEGPNLIDLRGKTSLFELLSIIKNRCSSLILPDSGILSMSYYLDEQFPIQLLSLWADPYHGILKQAVSSPNRELVHVPLISGLRDLSSLSSARVIDHLIPVKPLYKVPKVEDAPLGSLQKTACILLAGGQGSRLGFSGPKGTFPILGKSLFEWICSKVPVENFPIAVMTSPENHEETVAFFKNKNNFGREIYFFQQETLPFLNQKKEPTTWMAPNGNGGVYRAFSRSPLKELFLKKGIETVTMVPVENPLANPVDRSLIGHLQASSSEVVLKCVPREKREESMGVLVEREGRVEVVEYIHLDPSICYPYSYAGMMAFSFPFFLKAATFDLPLHWVQKKPPHQKEWAWKRESFVFDVLAFADRVSSLCYARAGCYAPLKSCASLESVEGAMKDFLWKGDVEKV